MKIGLDIDNVVANFDKDILKEYFIEDKKKRNKGIVNNQAEHIVKGMFDWSKEEQDEFFNNNMERIAKTLEPRDGAKYYMNKMIDDGHELYLISNRVHPHYNNPFEVTEKWLNEKNLKYTKLILSKTKNKSLECNQYNIDIMFDDSKSNCQKLLDSKINCFLMKTNYNNAENCGLPFVLDWKNLYEIVCDEAIKMEKEIHVILDTDTNNEADDQFALAYLLKSSERIILDAITIAPYSHENDINIEDGLNKSYKVCEKIFELLDIESENKIFRGSTNYLKNGYDEETDAIKRMVEIIKENDSTTIIAIGAFTNIGILLKRHPDLKSKIKIVWLGGHNCLSGDNKEYNFKQDLEANRIVFESGTNLTVIPCNGVATNLTTSIYELQNYFDVDRGLGKFLYDRFYNDGKHGITERRVIWDISAIGYVINPYWFESFKIRCPKISDELKYIESDFKHEITFVNKINVNKLYEDMFNKIGDFK